MLDHSNQQMSFETTQRLIKRWINQQLDYRLGHDDAPLNQAMRYACLHEGKRLRPMWVMATAQLFQPNIIETITTSAINSPLTAIEALALAVELIHAYSLIHDDLPAMDDDDLRRGMPTVHRQFDEGIAILAGDGLQSLAFDWLAGATTEAPDALLSTLNLLARTTGPMREGMVWGQAIDIALDPNGSTAHDMNLMLELHAAKTGGLFEACIHGAALLCGVTALHIQAQLKQLARTLGVCFQFRDDSLDASTDALDSQYQQAAINTQQAACQQWQQLLTTLALDPTDDHVALFGALMDYCVMRTR